MKKKNSSRIKSPVGAPAEAVNIHLVMAELRAYANAERSLVVDMDEEIAATRARYDQPNSLLSDPYAAQGLLAIKEKIADLTLKAQTWAEAHPDRFTRRKSIELTDGTLGFRTGTPKLVLLNRKFNWSTALQLVCRWLPNFIRSVPEIDKEALIAQRDEQIIADTLPKCGLKVTQDESFFVEPNLTELDNRQTTASPLPRGEGQGEGQTSKAA